MTRPSRLPALAPFFTWLVLFYSVWLWLVWDGSRLETVLGPWPIALSMAFGSYIAGATPMGGGTVGFPILVLLFDLPATLGRDFSFAVQAIGMSSASIYILCRRHPLEWPMLRAALPGAALGTPLGILLLAPLVNDLFIKLLFAAVWCSFGLIHLRYGRELAAQQGRLAAAPSFDRRTGFAVGLIGSLTVASVTGAGVDMLLYMTLVLLCRADLKIAIPTSVILMAFTSLVGTAVKGLSGDFSPGTFDHWLAAAPIVALGAPLGALVVNWAGRESTLVLVSLLCVLQFFWTLMHERANLTAVTFSAVLLLVAVLIALFLALRKLGQRMDRRHRQAT